MNISGLGLFKISVTNCSRDWETNQSQYDW